MLNLNASITIRAIQCSVFSLILHSPLTCVLLFELIKLNSIRPYAFNIEEDPNTISYMQYFDILSTVEILFGNYFKSN
jgi:hypothetical protein